MRALSVSLCGALLVICCLVLQVSATLLPDSVAVSDARCTSAGGYYVVNKTAFYSSTFTLDKSICVKKYLDACATPFGLQLCNMKTSSCAPVGYSWNDAVQYPAVASVMAQRPEMCTSANTVRSSGTSVILIAQIIVSGIVLIAAFIVFVVLVKCSPVIKVLLVAYLIPCIILLFSYYYLNAIVIFTTALAAAACLGFHTDRGFALCCAFLLLGFFWVTYSDGLGYAQHHARFQAGAANFGYQSELCDKYYDGFFGWPADAHADNQNLLLLYRGMCAPDWLSTELFFMILVEQLMVPFIAIAALLHFRHRKEIDAETPEASHF